MKKSFLISLIAMLPLCGRAASLSYFPADTLITLSAERRTTPELFVYDWRDAVLMNALVAVRDDHYRYREYVESYVAKTMARFDGIANGRHPNAMSTGLGYPFLQRAGRGTQAGAEAWARILKDYEEAPKSDEGAVSHRPNRLELWDDTMYMTGMPLIQAYKATRDVNYLEQLAKEIVAHAEHLRDNETGMWYHGWAPTREWHKDWCSMKGWNDNPDQRNHDFWGRGNGWIAMIFADLLEVLPKESGYYRQIRDYYLQMMKTLSRYQDSGTGHWCQLPVRKGEQGNFLESSCTAMFGYAMAKGNRCGLLGRKYRTMAEKAYDGLVAFSLENRGTDSLTLGRICAGTCIGDVPYYYQRKIVSGDTYAIGAFILLANELGKVSEEPITVNECLHNVADGIKMASPTIQEAIDKCAAAGGGVVSIPEGKYLCGPIVLRSNVELHLCQGAEIKGVTDFRHGYDLSGIETASTREDASFAPVSERALVLAINEHNVKITGPGVIDGQSNLVDFKAGGFKDNDGRPYGVLFKQCRNVTVEDVTICNAGFWTLRIWECDTVKVDNIRISSLHFRNNDGIDIEARNAVITNCIIDAEDDGICFKSDSKDFICDNITVSNCIVSSNCNPIKFGTASFGGWKNVTIKNCIVRPTPASHFRSYSGWYKNVLPGYLGGMSGVAIEIADGGIADSITVSNITMTGVLTPVFINLNRRHGLGSISNISISNIAAEAEGVLPCMVVGLPEAKVSNVSLRNINVTQRGGMKAMTKPVPESPTSYPENRMYGHILPACGLYLRHVDGISVENMNVTILEQDYRPCIYLDDVTAEKIRGVQYTGSAGSLRN